MKANDGARKARTAAADAARRKRSQAGANFERLLNMREEFSAN